MRTIVFIAAILLPTLAIAQPDSKWECSWGRFIQGSKVLFHDSLDNVPLNTRGPQWQATNAVDGIVKRAEGRNVRCFYGQKVNAVPASLNASGKWITWESDFTLNDSAAVLQVVLTYGAGGERKIVINRQSISNDWYGDEKNYGIGSFYFPNWFQSYVVTWHHLSLIFTKDCMDAFVDGKRLIGLGHDTTFSPHFVGYRPSEFYLAGKGPYALANIHFAESDEVPTNFTSSLDELTTAKRLSTQAITFDYNKADIKPESAPFINQLADWLIEHPGIKLKINGHTDNVGSAEFNQKLSEERANEVKNRLVSSGIVASRLSAQGFGATKPLKANTTEEGRAANRRVEFVIVP